MSLRVSDATFKRIKASCSKDFKKIFYIACEGSETEIQYFNSLEENKRHKNINISEEIKIKAMSQQYNNPVDLLKHLNEIKEKIGLDEYELCLVVDRDFKNFTDEQFEEVLSGCNDNKINLGLSNPCFELWLLLHFVDCQNNKIDLLKNSNDYIQDQITKSIKILNPNFQSYKKNKVKSHFNYYLGNIKNAISNAKTLETNNADLKTMLGTSVGKLMEKILESKPTINENNSDI